MQTLGIPRDSLISESQWYWWRGRIEMLFGPLQYMPVRVAPATRPSIPVQDTTCRAHDAIEVHLRNLRSVGAAIDTALAHGVSQISPIRFTATDMQSAQDEALREATRRARGQAQAIAESGGAQLGRLLSLSTDHENGSGLVFGLASLTIDASGRQGARPRR